MCQSCGELQAIGAECEYVRESNRCDVLFDLDAERQSMVRYGRRSSDEAHSPVRKVMGEWSSSVALLAPSQDSLINRVHHRGVGDDTHQVCTQATIQ